MNIFLQHGFVCWIENEVNKLHLAPEKQITEQSLERQPQQIIRRASMFYEKSQPHDELFLAFTSSFQIVIHVHSLAPAKNSITQIEKCARKFHKNATRKNSNKLLFEFLC